MLYNSINTNVGAMVALQNLNSTNSELSQTQTRINTGKKVASAKDNGSIWAIAQNQRATLASFGAVKDSLDRGASTLDVAIAGGENVADLLVQMKEKALAATDTTLDTTSRTALNNDFTMLRDQITKVIANAEFNGKKLLDTGATALTSLANADGTSTLSANAEVMALGGTVVTVTGTSGVDTTTNAAASLTLVNASIKNVNLSLTRLGTASKAWSLHNGLISKISDAVEAGIGNLVDADMAKESARLQALQTKQQLGVQALSIANTTPQSILSLFRG